jgi:hypothetical protein
MVIHMSQFKIIREPTDVFRTINFENALTRTYELIVGMYSILREISYLIYLRCIAS